MSTSKTGDVLLAAASSSSSPGEHDALRPVVLGVIGPGLRDDLESTLGNLKYVRLGAPVVVVLDDSECVAPVATSVTREALSNSGLRAEDIQAVIYCSDKYDDPERPPAGENMSSVLGSELGLDPKFCLDTLHPDSSYSIGLQAALVLIMENHIQHALVVRFERASNVTLRVAEMSRKLKISPDDINGHIAASTARESYRATVLGPRSKECRFGKISAATYDVFEESQVRAQALTLRKMAATFTPGGKDQAADGSFLEFIDSLKLFCKATKDRLSELIPWAARQNTSLYQAQILDSIDSLKFDNEALYPLLVKQLKESGFMEDKPNVTGEFYSASTPEELSVALVAIRQKYGLSQRTVAKRMSTSPSNIVRLEKGRTTPTMGTLQKYAEAIGAEVEIVFKPKEKRTAPVNNSV